MEYGVHLPLISFRGESRTLRDLLELTETAREYGYRFLCANDHLVFSRPWLDGSIALAAVLAHSGEMRLATTLCLPVVRGPAPTAKWLAAIDYLSGGRLVIGVGPGSSPRDYALVGLSYVERWQRLEECIHVLRAYFGGTDYVGKFYTTHGERLEPRPAHRPTPPIWLGSWGARGGLRRTAGFADGWLASGYNTDPDRFARSLADLNGRLTEAGKDPNSFPNGIATMWMYVTEDERAAAHMLEHLLAPMLNRPADELRSKLPIGSPEECADRLRRYRRAGAQRVFLWPLADEVQQLRLFRERVAPLVESD